MRVGVSRRIGSYLLDIIPIFALLSLLFSLFVGDLLKPDGYDQLMEEFQVISEDYNDQIAPFYDEWQAGDITEDEYYDVVEDYRELYNDDVEEHTVAMLQYFQVVAIYYIAAYTAIYYVYNLVTKGRTVGRKMMKIELEGKITWWTLLLREVIWKTGYYMLTLLIGGVLLDIALIGLTNKKKAPRDFVTGITLKFEGVNYPF